MKRRKWTQKEVSDWLKKHHKSFPIISEKESFDRLKEGYFCWYGSNDLEGTINVPAIKN